MKSSAFHSICRLNIGQQGKKICHLWGNILLILIFFATPLPAQTILFQQGQNNYQGCSDAHILINKTDHNTGAEDMLEASGNGGIGDAKHTLIRFNISQIPAGAQVDSAWLELYFVQRRTAQTGSKTLGIFQVNKPWGEGQGNDPGGLDGRAVIPGECDWNMAQFPSLPWTSPGCDAVPQDRSGIAEDIVTFTKNTPTEKWYSWNITRLCKRWIALPDSNFGLILRETKISSERGIIDFASSQYNTAQFRPILKVKLKLINSIMPGEFSETHTPTAIHLAIRFFGDVNHNAAAQLSHKLSGSNNWTDDGTMSRDDSLFVGDIYHLQPESIYVVRVTFSDTDGVIGENPKTLKVELPPETANIRLIACDSSHVTIQMTDYRIVYDKSNSSGLLLIFPAKDSTAALATSFLSESSFHLLQPQNLNSIEAKNSHDSLTVTFKSKKSAANFETRLIFYKSNPGLIHWITTIQLEDWHSISSLDKDVLFYKINPASALQPSIKKYADQDGLAAGLTYFYEKNFIKSTVLYFQDFSLSNSYYQWIHASPKNLVGCLTESFGYSLPTSSANLKKGETYTLSSAYLFLTPGSPSSEIEMAQRFLQGLSAVYKHIYKPVFHKHNWEEIADQTLQNLASPKCWTDINGHNFLRAYVDIPRFDSAEMIAQLDVLTGIYRYERNTGYVSPLKEIIENNLPFFFNKDHQQIVNNYPNQGISRGDSWYTIELAIGLSQLAKMGSSIADSLLFRSIQSIIRFARTVHYDFPVFFSYDTFQGISGSEPDVAGGYAYLMLNCYDLTNDSLYLNEARTAIAHISGKGLNLSYELQMTAATAAACARLYRITGDASYFDLSKLPLANILRHTWIWECSYGMAKDYSTFFGMSPMPNANVITMKEQYETWEYIREYLDIVGDELPYSVKNILDNFIRFTPNVLFYSLPPNLPTKALWTETATYGSHNDNSLFIPYEDLRDGWQKSGQIGQEIYGAGGVLSLAAVLKTSVNNHASNEVPRSFVLLQNFPNPFQAATRIIVELPPGINSSRGRKIQLKIYNTLGEEVRSFLWTGGFQGKYLFNWDGKNQRGQQLPAGVYFAVLKLRNQIARKKMVLMR